MLLDGGSDSIEPPDCLGMMRGTDDNDARYR